MKCESVVRSKSCGVINDCILVRSKHPDRNEEKSSVSHLLGAYMIPKTWIFNS